MHYILKNNNKIATIIALVIIGIIIGIIIALLIGYLFPTSVKSIPIKLFSTLPAHNVTIIFKLDNQKHRKKRKKK